METRGRITSSTRVTCVSLIGSVVFLATTGCASERRSAEHATVRSPVIQDDAGTVYEADLGSVAPVWAGPLCGTDLFDCGYPGSSTDMHELAWWIDDREFGYFVDLILGSGRSIEVKVHFTYTSRQVDNEGTISFAPHQIGRDGTRTWGRISAAEVCATIGASPGGWVWFGYATTVYETEEDDNGETEVEIVFPSAYAYDTWVRCPS